MPGALTVMKSARLNDVLAAIDRENSADPTSVEYRGERLPLALAEGISAHDWILRLREDDPRGGPETLLIAARGHHIRRWETPRSGYPEGRQGYLAWRRHLYDVHARHLIRIMSDCGYGEAELEAVDRIVHKRGMKRDPDVQSYEDAVALAFFEIQFGPFADRTERPPLLRAIRKTWRKMSPAGRELVGSITFPAQLSELVREAVDDRGE